MMTKDGQPTVFDQRLSEGHKAEYRVAWALYRAGYIIGCENKGPQADFWCYRRGLSERIEVKNEDRYADSGNLCIEFWQGHCERKPSGILISESSICVHTLGDRVAAYRTQPMRLFLRRGAYPMKPFGAADNGNEGAILPIADVLGQPWFAVGPLARLGETLVFTPMESESVQG